MLLLASSCPRCLQQAGWPQCKPRSLVQVTFEHHCCVLSGYTSGHYKNSKSPDSNPGTPMGIPGHISISEQKVHPSVRSGSLLDLSSPLLTSHLPSKSSVTPLVPVVCHQPEMIFYSEIELLCLLPTPNHLFPDHSDGTILPAALTKNLAIVLILVSYSAPILKYTQQDLQHQQGSNPRSYITYIHNSCCLTMLFVWAQAHHYSQQSAVQFK